MFIDGPFGAPTSQIFRAQHAVLIGTGIGVTPFASILQSIMHRYWQERNECPRCKYNWTNDLSSSSVLNLRKVDFFWINRDQVHYCSSICIAHSLPTPNSLAPYNSTNQTCLSMSDKRAWSWSVSVILTAFGNPHPPHGPLIQS